MAKVLYTAEAEVTGGRMEGHGRTSDGALEVDIRIPEALGGPGGGTNPEQLFAVGFASCFESALAVVARRAKVEAGDAKVASKVNLMPTGDGGFTLSVEMDVTMPSVDDRDQAQGVGGARRTRCAHIQRHARATSTWRSRPTARPWS